MRLCVRRCLCAFLGVLAFRACSAETTSQIPVKATVDFTRDIRPILSEKCFYCHGPDASKRQAGLRLDSSEGAYAAYDNGRAVVPGKPDKSEVVTRILSQNPADQMPPPKSNRTLSSAEIELLRQWIADGAKYAGHWAFEPLRQAEPPAAKSGAWARNPIDRFVLARLEKEGLSPSPETPRETLLRRVTLDLTGLPPTPAEVDAFIADAGADSYGKAVDRLLASPAFGERMAWDWLDAARYADSNGYQGDNERTMWPWRDWVVRAFNSNLPFDQFTVWQLAGDQLPNATVEQKMATGFCRNHMINGEGGRIAEENRIEYVFDQIETLGTVWLGMTFNCCRCHDHKYDQLTRRDYYGLFAFFNQTQVDGGGGDPQTKPNLELPNDEQKTQLAKLDDEVQTGAEDLDYQEDSFFPRDFGKSAADSPAAAKLPDKVKNALKKSAVSRNRNDLAEIEKEVAKPNPEHAKLLKAQIAVVDKRDAVSKAIPRVMIMEDMAKPRKTFMLEKGLYDKPRDEVTASVPAVLPALPKGAAINRLSLARWVVAPENPLPARVTVNRFWQQFFGIGLVKTPEDFGTQSEFPPHRDLLNWLAAEFVRSGWDVKALCRQIVTSAAYRQSSKVSPALRERDPENRLMARGPRFRMPAWMIRDQALAASGLLVAKIGGPAVKPYQPPGVWEEATFGNKRYSQDKDDALHRRSLYTFWRRIIGPTEFFDSATRQTCTVKQLRTNSPMHALTTLNDVTFVEASRVLAERILTSASSAPDARIEFAVRCVMVRKPSPEEKTVLLGSLERLRKEFAADPVSAKKYLQNGEFKRNDKLDPVEHAAYAAVCLLILNLDEALTKE